MRVFLLARHGQSTLNLEGRVNGDPAVTVDLTEQGVAEARRLADQVRAIDIDVGVHTRFSRTRRTLELALEGREIPLVEEPLLDDIRVGDLEGATIADYRSWKRAHSRYDRFPGGESLDEAAARYADAFERLLARPERVVLVVCHEIPLRYAVNGAAGSAELDGPLHDVANATPYVFDEAGLRRAAQVVARLADSRAA